MRLKQAQNEKRSAKIKTTKFEIGQAVRLWQPVTIEGKKAKLTQKWFGPYFIRDIKNEGRVIYLKDDENKEIPLPVSVNRIWPYPSGLIQQNNTSSQVQSEMALDEGQESEEVEQISESEESLSSDDEDDSENEKPDHVIEPEPEGDTSGAYASSQQTEVDNEEEERVETDGLDSSNILRLPSLKQIKTSSKYNYREMPVLRQRKTRATLVSRPLPRFNKRTKKRS
jgi:hypothetical protein